MRRWLATLGLILAVSPAAAAPPNTPWPGQCAPTDLPSVIGCQPQAENPTATNVLLIWETGQSPKTRAVQVQQLLNTGTPGTFSNLTVTGNETVGGTLSVTGATTLASLAATSGTFSGTLGVTGNTLIGGTLGVSGATTLGTLAASNGTFSGFITVAGFSTLHAMSATSGAFSAGVTVGGAISVTGSATVGAGLFVTGVADVGGLTTVNGNFSGNVVIGGALHVAGPTTLGGLAATTGNFSSSVTIDGNLGVTGTLTSGAFVASSGNFASSVTVGTTLAVGGSGTFGDVVQVPNGVAFRAKDTGGTYRNLIYIAGDNYTNTTVAGGAGTHWRVLNQAESAELFGVDNLGNVNVAGNTTNAGSVAAGTTMSAPSATFGGMTITGSLGVTVNIVASGTIQSSGAMGAGTTFAAGTTIAAGTGYLDKAGTGGGFGGHAFNIYDGANPHLYIDNTDLGVFQFVSDRRIKQSIVSAPSGALARVNSLHPRIYRLKDVGIFHDDKKDHLGFITDEVQAVVPSAVSGAANATQADGTPQPQSLIVVPLVAELWGAVQELSAELQAYKAAHP